MEKPARKWVISWISSIRRPRCGLFHRKRGVCEEQYVKVGVKNGVSSCKERSAFDEWCLRKPYRERNLRRQPGRSPPEARFDPHRAPARPRQATSPLDRDGVRSVWGLDQDRYRNPSPFHRKHGVGVIVTADFHWKRGVSAQSVVSSETWCGWQPHTHVFHRKRGVGGGKTRS